MEKNRQFYDGKIQKLTIEINTFQQTLRELQKEIVELTGDIGNESMQHDTYSDIKLLMQEYDSIVQTGLFDRAD